MAGSTKVEIINHLNTLFQPRKTQLSSFFKGSNSSAEGQKQEDPDHFKPSSEFARYERSIANNLGYFAVSTTHFLQDHFGNYSLKATKPMAQFIYWSFYVNTLIKSIFLTFLVLDYFGPVIFLDKIAALDYILCVGIVVCGTYVWGPRYPMHEILKSFWSIENQVFKTLGYPQELKARVERDHWKTVWIHLIIVWVGCGCLVIQFYADPKYCTFTYSSFELDTWWLQILFCAHEFFFMMHPWNNNAGLAALCTIEGTAIANLIDQMTGSLKALYNCEHVGGKVTSKVSKDLRMSKDATTSVNRNMDGKGNQNKYDSIEKLIFDYKQFIINSDQFNQCIAYKVLILHICGYCQFISDVFVAIQVLKLGGTFMDVWFYLEDCFVGVYMIYRVYTFMSLVAVRSGEFLRAFQKYRTFGCPKRKLKYYTKIARTLKLVGLKLGPFIVTRRTALRALDTFGNYYVCVALW